MRVRTAILALAAALVGCGGSESSEQAPVDAGPSIGAGISLADCTDWKEATVDERLGTIRELENFAGGPVGSGTPGDPTGSGAVLDDEQAYDILDNYCEQDFARAFKLYKLYQRAASFAGQPGG